MSEADYPRDVMDLAEEALDDLLCNCKESCGGYDGLRAASISDIARAIMKDRSTRQTEEIERFKRALERVAGSDWCDEENMASGGENVSLRRELRARQDIAAAALAAYEPRQ